MNIGWIRLYRELLDKTIWKNSSPEQKSILITLLLIVNHSSKQWEWQGQKFNLQPGQTITSLEAIAQKAGKGISIQNVRTALKRFEKLGFLTNESTKTGRLITILNFDIYQNNNNPANSHSNNQSTNDQQSHNNPITTNNNDNNKNNEEEPNKLVASQPNYLALKVIDIFCELHQEHFAQDYFITNQEKEIAAAQKIIKLTTSKNDYENDKELLESIKVFLTECFKTDDKWIKNNMSLSIILNKINYFNKSFNNGNTRTNTQSNISEYAKAVFDSFEEAKAD